MKSSAKEGKARNHRACLIVDGYNVIAKMNKVTFRDIENMDELRERLVHRLAEYSAFAGEDVVVVFDAYQTKFTHREHARVGVTVLYTELHETADERIERMVYELQDTYRQVTVATSDSVEQQVTFGKGALRISASGLLRRLDSVNHQIRNSLRTVPDKKKMQILDVIRQDIANILEKWRRE